MIQFSTHWRTVSPIEPGGAKSIALYNFGKGKNGDAVEMLRGAATRPCPSGASTTISGRFERGDGRALDNNLISEFDSERIYVEIVGGNDKPEIRGQLAPNGAMVMVKNYVAHLAPCPSSKLNPREFIGGFERMAIA